MSSESQSQS
jgi:translation initiation factor 5A